MRAGSAEIVVGWAEPSGRANAQADGVPTISHLTWWARRKVRLYPPYALIATGSTNHYRLSERA